MERARFSQRGDFLQGYAAQRSFEGPNVDFNDVFGGPPRRFSLQESTTSWYSSDGSMDSDRRLSGEKPVFGEESSSSSSSSNVNRRKHNQGSDFFDDIFQGDKSCASPRRDFLNSLPGLQIMSPSRPLPPKSEPFGSSVPAQFRLPPTLNKAMNYPTFGSSTSSFKQKEVTSNGISSPNSSLSRFSSQPMQGNDDFRNDVFPSNRPSHLSSEFSNAESSNVTKSNEADMRGNSKGDAKVTQVPTDINQFHFSIHKWAGEGAPLVRPPREGISSNSSKIKKGCSSSNGRVVSDKANDTENHNISVNFESSKMEREKLDKTSTLKREETCHVVEEDVLIKPKPEVLETTQITVDVMLSSNSEERKTSSLPEIILSEKTEKKISVLKEEAHKPDLKSLRSILQDEIDRLDSEDIIMKGERKQNVAKTSRSNAAGSKNVKKHEGKRINSDRVEVNKASNIPGLPKIPGGNLKGSGVRGKVKDFAKIFNQETYSKSKSCRWEGKVNEASVDTTEMNFLDMNKMPDSFFMVNENVEKPEKHHSHMKSKIHTSTDNSYNQNEASQFSESIPDGSKVTSDNINDPFQENYLIQDLSDDHVKLPQTREDLEATKALDAKILKWSTGKIGNIRSLLSTLQYVLWAESGWNPVPLVNIIEGNEVKRAYQKALLCLHPDKLQQKGAASHQKYIAEKVFDILQEAWDHFNSLGSI